MTVYEVGQAALALDVHERAALAAELLASLDTSATADLAAVEDAWRLEVARRDDDLRSGRVVAEPYEAVRERLQARFAASAE